MGLNTTHPRMNCSVLYRSQWPNAAIEDSSANRCSYLHLSDGPAPAIGLCSGVFRGRAPYFSGRLEGYSCGCRVPVVGGGSTVPSASDRGYCREWQSGGERKERGNVCKDMEKVQLPLKTALKLAQD